MVGSSSFNFSKLLHGFLQLILYVDIASLKCDVGPTSLPVCASAIAKIHVLLVNINDIHFLSSILLIKLRFGPQNCYVLPAYD